MEIKRGPLTTKNHKGEPDERECVYLEFGKTIVAVSGSANHPDRIAIKIVSDLTKMPWIVFRRKDAVALMKIIAIGLQELVEEEA